MEMCSSQGEIDPQVCLLSNKVALLLRVMVKFPHTTSTIAQLLTIYNTQARPGTPEGRQHIHTHTYHNIGPISHLLMELHQVKATLADDLTL